MATKFRIARKAALLGIHTYIANGKTPGILPQLLAGEGLFTCFPGQKSTSNLKKRLAYQNAVRKGAVHINEGAAAVLRNREQVSSLLPVGVTEVEGEFDKGDLIGIILAGEEIGLGMAQYGAATARKYLGQKGKKALIHYDYLLIG